MIIKDFYVDTYHIRPIGENGWAARGFILTDEGDKNTSEVFGRTEEEARNSALSLTKKEIKRLTQD